jgi:hypothetical protein
MPDTLDSSSRHSCDAVLAARSAFRLRSQAFDPW